MKKKVMIIGGGFYGMFLSNFLSSLGFEITLCEKEDKLMSRSSLINQARVHKGFHYCRSALTALRSSISYIKFINNYKDAIETNFNSYYAISKLNSKTTANQFEDFLSKLSINYNISSDSFKDLFNNNLVEQIYQVEEKVFNSHVLLEIMSEKLANANVSINLNTFISNVHNEGDFLLAKSNNHHVENIKYDFIFNCTYSGLNFFNENNKLNLKHRVSEMALVSLPAELQGKSITLMDGPFFSLMPYPTAGKGIYSLSHVNYTHHDTLNEGADFYKLYRNPEMIRNIYKSNYKYMLSDASRFLPCLGKLEYVDSIWDIKTTLLSSDVNDSRPIVFNEDKNKKNFFSVLGGKIDNVFDLEDFIKNKFKLAND